MVEDMLRLASLPGALDREKCWLMHAVATYILTDYVCGEVQRLGGQEGEPAIVTTILGQPACSRLADSGPVSAAPLCLASDWELLSSLTVFHSLDISLRLQPEVRRLGSGWARNRGCCGNSNLDWRFVIITLLLGILSSSVRPPTRTD